MKASKQDRREAAIDFAAALAVVLVSIPCIPALTPAYRRLNGFTALFTLATLQFATEGLVPLIVMAIRHERFSDYGFNGRNIRNSIVLAVLLALAYDFVLSIHARAWLWIPLRRHNAVRNSLAAGFPLSVFGIVVVVAVWGFLEAFFGVFFARKLNQLLGHSGQGWLAPGVLGFAVFNGAIHAAIGQGVTGFLTSFATGYAIAAIPAITANAWGSSLFQTLTNSVGSL